MDKKNGSDPRLSDQDITAKESHAPAVDDAKGTPKKRRKVNHGMRSGEICALCPPAPSVQLPGFVLLIWSLCTYSMRILPAICKSSQSVQALAQ